MEERLLELVARSGTPPAPKRIHTAPRIPEALLSRLWRAIGLEDEAPSEETALIVVDSSKGLFSRLGSSGLLVTTRRVYDVSSWGGTFFMREPLAFALSEVHRLGVFTTGEGQPTRVVINGVFLLGSEQPPKELVEPKTVAWVAQLLGDILTVVQEGAPAFTARDVARSYRGVLRSKNLFFGDDIPQSALENARSAYARYDESSEVPLVLYIDGKKGKRGVVLTDRHLFGCTDGHDFYRAWDLSSIKSVWLGTLRGRGFSVVIDDARMSGWPTSFPPENLVLANMIASVASTLRPPSMALPLVSAVTDFIDRPDLNFNVTEPRVTHKLR